MSAFTFVLFASQVAGAHYEPDRPLAAEAKLLIQLWKCWQMYHSCAQRRRWFAERLGTSTAPISSATARNQCHITSAKKQQTCSLYFFVVVPEAACLFCASRRICPRVHKYYGALVFHNILHATFCQGQALALWAPVMIVIHACYA
jgi:hypothetical protein